MGKVESVLGVVALLYCGCFNPNTDGTIKCNPAETGNCLDGQVCSVLGICAPTADAGTQPPVVTDLVGQPPMDLYQPPIAPNCTSLDPPVNSYLICTGVFTSGFAYTLCPIAKGYRLARTLPGLILAACGDQKLITNNQFFAADVGYWGSPQNPFTIGSCSPVTGWVVGLRGCGHDPGVDIAFNMCGWPAATLFSYSSNWSGAIDGTVTEAANKNPNHGVVCAKQ